MNKFTSRIKLAISPFYWFGRVYSFLCHLRFKSCSSGFNAAYTLIIRGGERITIGNKISSMGSSCLYANEGELVIGDFCSMNTNVQIGATAGRIIIGDDVMM
jgi:acetyltransferase-like isoleucine patch superfamily enzyme